MLMEFWRDCCSATASCYARESALCLNLSAMSLVTTGTRAVMAKCLYEALHHLTLQDVHPTPQLMKMYHVAKSSQWRDYSNSWIS